MRYATRNHAFAKETTWVLDGDTLRVEDGAGPPRMMALRDIASVRLEFSPTRFERNRFRCRLKPRNGAALEFFNWRYAGLANFPDTSAEYVPFVRELVAALLRHAPGCRFQGGVTWLSYTLNLLLTGFVLVCLALVSLFLYQNSLSWLIGLKVLILIFYVPTLVYWLKRNRPRTFVPPTIPDELLPEMSFVKG